MMARVIPADFTIDRTPKRKRKTPAFFAVLIFLAFTAAAGLVFAGCGGAAVTPRGFTVVGADGFMTLAEIDSIVDRVIEVAPAEDAARIRPALDLVTLTFIDDAEVPDCVDPGDIGCNTAISHDHRVVEDEIRVVKHTCRDGAPTASVIAHEIGHAVGHSGHGYVPWFGSDGHYETSEPALVGLWWCRDLEKP